MRVLVIVPDVLPYGGTSRFLERLLEIHARRDVVTTLLVPADRCHPAVVSLAKQFGAELIQSPNRTGPGTAPFLTPWYDFLFSWRTALTRRPDLIVVSTGDPGRLSIALYFPIPVLYILHSVPEQRFRLLPRWYLRFGAMLKNQIMTVSADAARAVSDFMGFPPERIEVVHNSCPMSSYRTESAEPIILTAGHLVAYKNPEVWLEVARSVVSEFPGSRFVWLGDGDQLQAIREKVKGMSLEERILLPGYVPDPSNWYAQAHIYFQPSLRESHGIAVLEAMARGLPCVVADIGGLPESVVDGETGYVCPPADSTAFAGRIIGLLGDPALRVRLGSAGRQRVERCFSVEIQEQKIVNIYRRLVNGRAI
jgi:glycosyltransferase involved in cell wall biosynthesis